MRRNDLIKDFNIFMYRHTSHHGKNIFFVIVYKHLVQKKILKHVNSKIMKEK